jgi:hypothetical protein
MGRPIGAESPDDRRVRLGEKFVDVGRDRDRRHAPSLRDGDRTDALFDVGLEPAALFLVP